ncbi:MAG: hypothetical protein KGO96_07375 [Elusimicrobia bacterium]|nr:hypothetical protein [Elusimicrobiota bacterium]
MKTWFKLIGLLLFSNIALAGSTISYHASPTNNPNSAITGLSFTSTAANGAYAFGVNNAGSIFCLNGNTAACSDNLKDDGSGDGVWTVAAGKNYQIVSGDKFCFDGSACVNSIDYGTSFAGLLTLTAGNSGFEINAPVLQSNLSFTYNGGTVGSAYTYSRSSAATGSLAWEWFKDNATTEIMGLSPAGVLTATDGTAGNQIELVPGTTPGIVVAGPHHFEWDGTATWTTGDNVSAGANVQAEGGFVSGYSGQVQILDFLSYEAVGNPVEFSRALGGTGTLAYEWFKDFGTTEILGLSPAGVATFTDGTAGHQVTITPGASPTITGGSTLFLNAGAGVVVVQDSGGSVAQFNSTNLQTNGFVLNNDTTHLAPIVTSSTTQHALQDGNVTCSASAYSVTFATAGAAFSLTPNCVVSDENGGSTVTVTTKSISTLAGACTTGHVIDWICSGAK